MSHSARCLPMATCSCASLLGGLPCRVLGVVSLCLDRIGRTAGGGRRRAGTGGRAGSRIRATGNDEPTARRRPRPNRVVASSSILVTPEIRPPYAALAAPILNLLMAVYVFVLNLKKLINCHTDSAAVAGAYLLRVLLCNVNAALASCLRVPVGVGFSVDLHERCRSRGWVVGA